MRITTVKHIQKYNFNLYYYGHIQLLHIVDSKSTNQNKTSSPSHIYFLFIYDYLHGARWM